MALRDWTHAHAPKAATATIAAATGSTTWRWREAFHASRVIVETGRARIGSPRRNRSMSSANASAEGYRRAGSRCIAFSQIVPRSAGTAGFTLRTGGGSASRSFARISSCVSPAYGACAVSIS